MGWDMDAVTANGNSTLTKDQLAKFKEASDKVVAEAGSVDGLLGHGGLDCSPCARAMEAMSDLSAWTDWSPAEMAAAFAGAEIPEDLTDEAKWAWHSAWHFMRVCAELGLGAHASY